MSDESKGGGFFAGFVFGAIAGGVLAYAIAQEEMRDIIVGKAREAGNFAVDATGDLRDLYARGRTVVDAARSNINAAVDEGQATADRLRNDLSQPTQPFDS